MRSIASAKNREERPGCSFFCKEQTDRKLEGCRGGFGESSREKRFLRGSCYGEDRRAASSLTTYSGENSLG